jgi:hypothetical protein
MHKSATKYNETIGKWCKNKHGASKIIDTLETYQWHAWIERDEEDIAIGNSENLAIAVDNIVGEIHELAHVLQSTFWKLVFEVCNLVAIVCNSITMIDNLVLMVRKIGHIDRWVLDDGAQLYHNGVANILVVAIKLRCVARRVCTSGRQFTTNDMQLHNDGAIQLTTNGSQLTWRGRQVHNNWCACLP